LPQNLTTQLHYKEVLQYEVLIWVVLSNSESQGLNASTGIRTRDEEYFA